MLFIHFLSFPFLSPLPFPYFLLSISLLPSLPIPPSSSIPTSPHSLFLFPSLPELSQERGLTCDDIISTLQYYSLLKYWKGKHIIIRRKVRLPEHRRGTKVFFHKTIQWNPFYDVILWVSAVEGCPLSVYSISYFSYKFVNSRLCSSTLSERTATLPNTHTCSADNDIIHCKVPSLVPRPSITANAV